MPTHTPPDHDPATERLAYSTTEFAEAFGVTRTHVQNLIARGELRSVRLGRRRLIPRQVVDDLLANGVSDEGA